MGSAEICGGPDGPCNLSGTSTMRIACLGVAETQVRHRERKPSAVSAGVTATLIAIRSSVTGSTPGGVLALHTVPSAATTYITHMTDDQQHITPLEGSPDSSPRKSPERQKPLYLRAMSDITNEDISEISSLQEGWFVEFKERSPENSKLARSVSSFANSHGGLLVIGAKEDQKTRRLAGYTPMTRDEADEVILRVREAVTSHVSPPTYFDAKPIDIEPCSSTTDARWIVLVHVPKGRFGPYLHSNGCVYIRVGDAAAPSALTDLAQQERLWAEALHRNEKLKARVQRLSDQFRYGTPAVHIAILADEDVNADGRTASLTDFREIALGAHHPDASSVFDHVQTLDNSFIARRTERKFDSASLIWDYDAKRHLHFLRLPLATHSWANGQFRNEVGHLELTDLAAILREESASSDVFIVNLLPTLFFLAIILHKVAKLHEKAGYTGTLRINACVVDAEGAVPYLGTPMYFADVKATGLPYVLREVGFYWSLDDPAGWMPLAHNPELTDLTQIDYANTFAVFAWIARSLGISPHISVGLMDDGSDPDLGPLIQMFSKLFRENLSFNNNKNPKR